MEKRLVAQGPWESDYDDGFEPPLLIGCVLHKQTAMDKRPADAIATRPPSALRAAARARVPLQGPHSTPEKSARLAPRPRLPLARPPRLAALPPLPQPRTPARPRRVPPPTHTPPPLANGDAPSTKRSPLKRAHQSLEPRQELSANEGVPTGTDGESRDGDDDADDAMSIVATYPGTDSEPDDDPSDSNTAYLDYDEQIVDVVYGRSPELEIQFENKFEVDCSSLPLAAQSAFFYLLARGHFRDLAAHDVAAELEPFPLGPWRALSQAVCRNNALLAPAALEVYLHAWETA